MDCRSGNRVGDGDRLYGGVGAGATENVGVAANGAGVPVPEIVAAPVWVSESVAVSVAVLRPTEVGVKLTVVANDAPVVVVVHAPLVAAENADAEGPVAANVTVGGVAVHPPSLRKVVILVGAAGCLAAPWEWSIAIHGDL